MSPPRLRVASDVGGTFTDNLAYDEAAKKATVAKVPTTPENRALGTVRGLSLFFSHLFAASGAPFFGFLHDRMGSYNVSFIIFSCALFTSAFLILLAKPPKKRLLSPVGAIKAQYF